MRFITALVVVAMLCIPTSGASAQQKIADEATYDIASLEAMSRKMPKYADDLYGAHEQQKRCRDELAVAKSRLVSIHQELTAMRLAALVGDTKKARVLKANAEKLLSDFNEEMKRIRSTYKH